MESATPLHASSGGDAMRQRIDRLEDMVKRLVADGGQIPPANSTPEPGPQSPATKSAGDMPSMAIDVQKGSAVNMPATWVIQAQKQLAGTGPVTDDNHPVNVGGHDWHPVLHEVTNLLLSTLECSDPNISPYLSHEHLIWKDGHYGAKPLRSAYPSKRPHVHCTAYWSALKNRYWKLRALLIKSSKEVTTSNRSSGKDMRLEFSMLSEPFMALGAYDPLKGSHRLLSSTAEQPLVEGGTRPPSLDPITPQSIGSKSELGSDRSGIGAQWAAPGVSITFSCTAGELGNAMSLVAGTGLNVSIKVDTK
ncbi:hypothetical protein PG991_003274 [Apiospora marii]|uniref:Uncharacterized protein n=1 Tax=Apiospora marii TaxID=335849 RepID=A0ABR1SJ22_9PEZI